MGLTLERVGWDADAWRTALERYPRAEVYHSPEWLEYLRATQGAEPVLAAVQDGGATVGHFVGAVVRRYGLSILGSPLAGWGTQMMGFLLEEGVDRREALRALLPFAYRQLGCVHVDVGDRVLQPEDVADLPYHSEQAFMSVVDLTGDDEALLAQMHPRTRTYARRGTRMGLRTELGSGEAFAQEYHDQLVDVFRSSDLVPPYAVERVRQLIRHLEPSGQVGLVRIVDAEGNGVGTSVTIGRNGRATLWGLAFYRQYGGLHPVEPLQLETMRYWRERGFELYNLAGAEHSKAKFTSAVESLVRLRHYRYPALDYGRRAIREAFYRRQRLMGQVRRRRSVLTGRSGSRTD